MAHEPPDGLTFSATAIDGSHLLVKRWNYETGEYETSIDGVRDVRAVD